MLKHAIGAHPCNRAIVESLVHASEMSDTVFKPRRDSSGQDVSGVNLLDPGLWSGAKAKHDAGDELGDWLLELFGVFLEARHL